jgi:hypothetical protein
MDQPNAQRLRGQRASERRVDVAYDDDLFRLKLDTHGFEGGDDARELLKPRAGAYGQVAVWTAEPEVLKDLGRESRMIMLVGVDQHELALTRRLQGGNEWFGLDDIWPSPDNQNNAHPL